MLDIVLASSTSFASSQARKLIRSAARPLPAEIASLDFGGDPEQYCLRFLIDLKKNLLCILRNAIMLCCLRLIEAPR